MTSVNIGGEPVRPSVYKLLSQKPMKSVSELMNLSGRVCLITGGAGHIGVTIADALAELGAFVILADKESSRCDSAIASIQDEFRGRAEAASVDIADEQQVLTLRDTVFERFGRLDVLINNAAFVGTSNLAGWTVPFEAQSVTTWQMAMDVNVVAAFRLLQVFAELLRSSAKGSVINMASIYGLVGPDMRLYENTSMSSPAAYAASKGALIQLTRWLATVLAPGIRVNCISPGGLWRQQPESFVNQYVARTPLRRMATEEDLKGAAVFLASDLSAYVTGQNIVVDGGWTAW